ncbi:MAG TPA: thiamine-phosphate kinase [Candidatus Acidoferrum sp.]|nr:thiamine-phosphate kinase [Candidatus Acidoferrum sp.]
MVTSRQVTGADGQQPILPNPPIRVHFLSPRAAGSICGRIAYSGCPVPVAEKALIAQVRRLAATAKNPAVQAGIGDDCAVLRLVSDRGKQRFEDKDTLVTTDFTLEGIHFRRDWHSAESVGHRCLARGLSDIAAMGGEPAAAFLSLALPRDLPQSWVGRFARSLISLAERYGVTLAGGDTAESPNGVLADIVVVGTVPKGKAVLRSRARPGDRIYVSGELGGSAAAVWQMRKKPKRKLNPREYPRHFFPEPRIELGRILREKGLATAMIDISDGLSTDLAHICQESGVGAELQAEVIPRASVGKPAREVDFQFALHGGEDYELLFTAPRGKRVLSRIAGVPITHIGQITRGPRVFLRNRGGVGYELQPLGWEHFRR